MDKSRLELQQDFAYLHGWGDADLFPLPPDASNRTYTRLVRGGDTCLLMDAPPETEKLPEFLSIAQHLSDLGLREPKIFASDTRHGFALVEDFGDRTFTQLLQSGECEASLYEKAVDVLIHVRRAGEAATKVDAPPYDMALMLEEVGRFLLWFVPAFRGRGVTEAERSAFEAAWQRALSDIAQERSSFVFRDFHVDNLMIVDEHDGLQAVGLLDFQDALIGHSGYDIASLIEDARRDVGAETAEMVFCRYLSAFPELDAEEFRAQVQILAAQRHTKIAGLFVRLSVDADKHQYLCHLPRVLAQLKVALALPALAGVRAVIEAILPDVWEAEKVSEMIEELSRPTSLLPI